MDAGLTHRPELDVVELDDRLRRQRVLVLEPLRRLATNGCRSSGLVDELLPFRRRAGPEELYHPFAEFLAERFVLEDPSVIEEFLRGPGLLHARCLHELGAVPCRVGEELHPAAVGALVLTHPGRAQRAGAGPRLVDELHAGGADGGEGGVEERDLDALADPVSVARAEGGGDARHAEERAVA